MEGYISGCFLAGGSDFQQVSSGVFGIPLDWARLTHLTNNISCVSQIKGTQS